MRRRTALVGILMACLFTSCTPPPLDQTLVGKWRETAGGGREVIEFSADGKVTTYYKDGDHRVQEMIGTYKVADANRVRMEFQGNEKEAQVSVGGDQLILRLPPQYRAVGYRRVR